MPTNRSSRLLAACLATARAIDNSPLGPRVLADRALDRWYDTRQRQAAADATWAGIEARRQRDGDGAVTFLSEDLTLADWETQRRIAEGVAPEPRWVPWARRATSLSATRAVRAVTTPWQRARRGYADCDVWATDTWLSRVAAQMLYQLADQAHGWPSDAYETYEEWVVVLRAHAAALERYAAGTDGELLAVWYDRVTDAQAESDEIAAAWEALNQDDAERDRLGAEAWEWVAKHHQRLWD